MTLPANIRVNARVPFPALVTGAGGIKVSKSNGVWTIEPDFSALSAVLAPAVLDPSSKEIWLYDPVSGVYNVLSLAGLGDALYKLTSTTSLAVGTGAKTFITESGKDITVGDWVLATDDAAPTTNWMSGQVTAYSGGSLTVGVLTIGGSGTIAAWTIRPSGTPGGTSNITGATTHGVGIATSGATMSSTAVMTDGQLLVGQSGADPLPKTVTGEVTITAAGATAIATNLATGHTTTSYNAGTKTTGTFTPDPSLGNIQHYVNGGAHALAPPAAACSMVIECTNASAGALTTSAFSIVDGDTYSSSGTKKHIFYITKTNSYSHLTVRYVTGS